MSQDILFSVIIATFQSVKSLRPAIESVIAQDLDASRFELIIVDGLSDDGTQALIQQYGSHVSHFISEDDEGIYDAWNKGIQLSRGQWILFIGADDMLTSDALSSFYIFTLENPHVDFVSAQVQLLSPSGVTRLIGKPWDWNNFRRFMQIAHVGSIHSSDLFRRHGLFSLSYSVCADYEYFLRIGSALKAGYLPKVVAIMSEGGVSQASIVPLLQSRRIKLATRSASMSEANYDFFLAFLKWSLRKAFSPFSAFFS